MLSDPRRRQINPPAVPADLDLLLDHFFTKDLKLDLAADLFPIFGYYWPSRVYQPAQ